MAKHSVSIDDIRVTYFDEGKGDAVFILHGWGGSKEPWRKIALNIVASGFRVIVPDLPGFGESDPPKSPFSVDDFARVVLQVAKKLKLPKIIVVGHSFGGRIGIKLAASHPNKIDRLVLCASAGIKPVKTMRFRMSRFAAALGKPLFALPFLCRGASFARRILYKVVGSRDYADAGANRETFKKVIEEDLRPYLSQISVPTLILWGTKDSMTPVSDAHVMHDAIRSSRLKVFDGISHGLHREIPDEISETIIHFLQTSP